LLQQKQKAAKKQSDFYAVKEVVSRHIALGLAASRYTIQALHYQLFFDGPEAVITGI